MNQLISLGAEARTRLVAVLQTERDYLKSELRIPDVTTARFSNLNVEIAELNKVIKGHLDWLLKLEI